MPEPRETAAFACRKARTEAKKAAAAERKVSLRTINRLKILDKPLESVRKRVEKSEKLLYRREFLEKTMQSVLSGEISAAQAAEACHLSLRQVYRHLAQARQNVK